MADSYPKMLKKMSAKEIEIEVNREANNRHRGYLATQRRIAIINLLLKTKTITEVAQIMKRDRSTINHYVEKYAN
jgi:DNA-binding NarL/FixJ family response regulator